MQQGVEKILEERFGFAHHQKTMLVDYDFHGQRYLAAYMGKSSHPCRSLCFCQYYESVNMVLGQVLPPLQLRSDLLHMTASTASRICESVLRA